MTFKFAAALLALLLPAAQASAANRDIEADLAAAAATLSRVPEFDADLLSALLHLNGFEAPRFDKKCGAEFAHAGCDPTSATPCCEGGRCVASAQCVSGHDHSKHVCNAAAWDTASGQERACEHCATPWQCSRRDRTASSFRIGENAVSLKALSGEALRETRVLFRFRGQVLRHAIDADPDDADEMERLRLLAEQTTAKMELLSDPTKSAAELASSAAEDIEWLKRLGGDPKKLGAVLNKLAEENGLADSQRAMRTEADFRLGLREVLSDAALPKAPPLCAPGPPTRYCCASRNLDDVFRPTSNHVAEKYGWTFGWGRIHESEDAPWKCMAYCMETEGSGFRGGSLLRGENVDPDCVCGELSMVEEVVAMPTTKCEQVEDLSPSLTCTREIWVEHECGSQRKLDQLALLRNEVVLPSLHAVPSARLLDPQQFDLRKCCTFDVYRADVDEEPSWVSKARSRGFDTQYEGGLEPSALLTQTALKGSDEIATDHSTACLSYSSDRPRKVRPVGGSDDDWSFDPIEWLRQTPGWDNGRNWIVWDTDDPAAGWGVNAAAAEAEAAKFPDIVAEFRSDHAIVLKTAMSTKANCAPRCKHVASDVHYGMKLGMDIALPLFSNIGVVPFALRDNVERKYLTFFKGNPSNPTRSAVIALHDPARGVIALGHKGYTAETDEYPYSATLAQAKFGLAPEGNGLHSFRLTECMQFGTVPVMVDRFGMYVLPFTEVLDWTKFGFYFALDDIDTLVDTLEAVPASVWKKMQKRSIAVYEQFFLPTNVYVAALEIARTRIRVALRSAPVGTCP